MSLTRSVAPVLAASLAVSAVSGAAWLLGDHESPPMPRSTPTKIVPFADVVADPVPPQVGAFSNDVYVQPSPSDPACNASQLEVSMAVGADEVRPDDTPSRNISIYFLDVRNTGPACALGGSPDATVLDQAGRRANVSIRAMRGDGPQKFLLPPDGVASTVMTWGRDCGQVGNRQFFLDLGPGNGRGTTRTRPLKGPGCRGDATEAFATIRTWELSTAARQRTPLTSPYDSSGLIVDVDLPATATRGERFEYAVAISNPGSQTVTLDPCPAYTVNMGVEASVGLYVQRKLNCEQAPASISPGESIVFAMEDVVPTGEEMLGQRTLRWDLSQYPSEATPQGEDTIQVL